MADEMSNTKQSSSVCERIVLYTSLKFLYSTFLSHQLCLFSLLKVVVFFLLSIALS